MRICFPALAYLRNLYRQNQTWHLPAPPNPDNMPLSSEDNSAPRCRISSPRCIVRVNVHVYTRTLPEAQQRPGTD